MSAKTQEAIMRLLQTQLSAAVVLIDEMLEGSDEPIHEVEPKENKPTAKKPKKAKQAEITADHVKDALRAYAAKHDRAAAKKIQKEVGGADYVSDIDPKKYAELLAALGV